jgi:VWFA-related protein
MRTALSLSLVALVFLVACLCLPSAAFFQEATPQGGVIKSKVEVVSVYFTVRDNKKRLADQLDQQAFRVFEDGKEQPIKFFAHHSDVVLNVGVLLDTGTSMTWILDEEADATSTFLNQVVRPSDLGFIVSYAARPETIQVPTSDTQLLQEKVAAIRTWGTVAGDPHDAGPPMPGVPPVGPTGRPYNQLREARLYDAIRFATQHFLEREVGRKAIVIVAMSGDSKSESTLEDALAVLLQNDVIAYVLQIYDAHHDNCDVRHIYSHDEHGEEVLKKLAESTGGRMLEVHGVDKLDKALQEISDELHHQYSLGYYPENQNWDGKFRAIQITSQERGYKVFARKGYYGVVKAAQ